MKTIKQEVEDLYYIIRKAEIDLKHFRTICEHKNISEKNYSYRVGSICKAMICDECGEIISTPYDINWDKQIEKVLTKKD